MTNNTQHTQHTQGYNMDTRQRKITFKNLNIL